MKAPNLQSASFLQRIGIAPGLVAVVVIVDSLLFSGEAATLGASLFLSIPAGILIAVFATYWQKKFYQDTTRRALLKGIILGILTTIPTPIASIVTIFGAVLPMLEQEGKNIDKKIHTGDGKDKSEDEAPEQPSIRKARGRTLS